MPSFVRAVQQPIGLPTFNKYAFIVLRSIGEAQILHGPPLSPRPCNPIEERFLIKLLFIYLIGL